MIEKALRYLVGLGEAHVMDIKLPDGTVQTYSDKQLNLLEILNLNLLTTAISSP